MGTLYRGERQRPSSLTRGAACSGPAPRTGTGS